jgi:hypothetical protein
MADEIVSAARRDKGDSATFTVESTSLLPMATKILEARGDTLRLLEARESAADVVNQTGRYGDSRTIAKRVLSPGLRDSLAQVERLIAAGDPKEKGICATILDGYTYSIRAGGEEYTCSNCLLQSCYEDGEYRRIQAIGDLISGIWKSFPQ